MDGLFYFGLTLICVAIIFFIIADFFTAFDELDD